MTTLGMHRCHFEGRHLVSSAISGSSDAKNCYLHKLSKNILYDTSTEEGPPDVLSHFLVVFFICSVESGLRICMSNCVNLIYRKSS